MGRQRNERSAPTIFRLFRFLIGGDWWYWTDSSGGRNIWRILWQAQGNQWGHREISAQHQTFSEYFDFRSGGGTGGIGQIVSAVGRFTESVGSRRRIPWGDREMNAQHQPFSDYFDFLSGGTGGIGQIVPAVGTFGESFGRRRGTNGDIEKSALSTKHFQSTSTSDRGEERVVSDR